MRECKKNKATKTDKIVYLNSSKTLYNLATKSNDKYKAIRYFNKALELAPICFDAHIKLAYIYNSIGQSKEAIFHFEQSLKQKLNRVQKSEIQKVLLSLYIKEKMFDEAKDLLVKRLLIFGDFGFFAKIKSKLIALFLKEGYGYKREYENILFILAYILREKSLYKLALPYAKKLLKINRQGKNSSRSILRKRTYLSYCYLIASIYECMEDFEGAKKYFSLIKKEHLYPSATVNAYEVIYEKMRHNGLLG